MGDRSVDVDEATFGSDGLGIRPEVAVPYQNHECLSGTGNILYFCRILAVNRSDPLFHQDRINPFAPFEITAPIIANI